MTVCIAMIFNNEKGLIVASDRMTIVGLPPMEFEHKRKKILDLGNGSIRHVTTELEKYNVDFNIETKV